MTDLVVLGLALWQAIEIWHHGAIFFTARAYFRRWLKYRRLAGWLGKLINCMFCLGVWVGTGLVSAYFLGGERNLWVRIPIWALAVVRFAQLGNDLTHGFNRSPPGDVIADDDQFEFTDFSGDVTPDVSNSITGYSNEAEHDHGGGNPQAAEGSREAEGAGLPGLAGASDAGAARGVAGRHGGEDHREAGVDGT